MYRYSNSASVSEAVADLVLVRPQAVTSSDFVAYVGPDYIHDSTIVSIERTYGVVTVHLRALDGREFSLEFLGVDSVSSEQPENMFLYALTEMRHPLPLRRFAFANSDDDSSAFLEIVAEDFTVSPPSATTQVV